MPKQVLQVTDFSAGLNAYSDAKDIEDNQFAQNWNAIVDKAGVIRVAGMAQDYITTEYHSSENFQKGYGLFQVSLDYPINGIDGSFTTGIKSGTASGGSSAGSSTINLEAGYSAEEDEFNNMSIFIYDGAGSGQTRKISDTADGASSQLTLASAWHVTTNNTSKYIIFRWNTDGTNWKGVGTDPTFSSTHSPPGNSSVGDVNEDYFNIGGRWPYHISLNPTGDINTAIDKSQPHENIFAYTKSGTVTSEQSKNLGYIEYVPGFQLTPGEIYDLSFDCASLQRWSGIAADGENTDASNGYGDKVPWVQLYSEDVSDSSGCVNKLTYSYNGSAQDVTTSTAYTVDISGVSGGFGTAWTADSHHQDVYQKYTSGLGHGLSLTITSAASTSDLTIRISEQKGSGYKVGDTITFGPPDGTGADIELTVASNGINRTGLSLYSNNKWVSKTNQSSYIADYDRNCVVNGDFSDTISTAWTEVDVGNDHLSVSQQGADESYSGITASTLKLTTTNAVPNNFQLIGPSASYIRTSDAEAMELDDLTEYHLNFLYQTSGEYVGNPFGFNYAIYDATNDDFIVNWTKLPSSVAKWSFPNQKTSLTGGSSSNNFNYISFKTPKNKSKTQVDSSYNKIKVLLYFSCDESQSSSIHPSTVFIHGVTVHKAHNDLVSMSYEKSGINPFSEDIISNMSTYNTRFSIPENYSTVSTWKLRIHAGQYSYVTNNNINVGSTQEVYIDNIKILPKNSSDTYTFLCNNANKISSIHAYSSDTTTWIKNLITWDKNNVKPVYTYINGILKISDANFSQASSNKLMYYNEQNIKGKDDNFGWNVIDSPFVDNISLSASESEDDDVSGQVVMNLIPFLNSYYKDSKIGHHELRDGTTFDFPSNYEPITTEDTSNLISDLQYAIRLFKPIGWPRDAFGTSVSDGDPSISGTGGNLKGIYNGFVLKHAVNRHYPSARFRHLSINHGRGRETATGGIDSLKDHDCSGDLLQCFVNADPLIPAGSNESLQLADYHGNLCAKHDRFLYNTESDWFYDNIDDGSGQGANPLLLEDATTGSTDPLSDVIFHVGVKERTLKDGNMIFTSHNVNDNIYERYDGEFSFEIDCAAEEQTELSPKNWINNVHAGMQKSIAYIDLVFEYTMCQTWNSSLSFCLPPCFIISVSSGGYNFEQKILEIPQGTLNSYTYFTTENMNDGEAKTFKYSEMDVNELDVNGNLVSIEQNKYGWDSLTKFKMKCRIGFPFDSGVNIDSTINFTMKASWDEQSGDSNAHHGDKYFETGPNVYGGSGYDHSYTFSHVPSGLEPYMGNELSKLDGVYEGVASPPQAVPTSMARYATFRISNIDMHFYNDGEPSTEELTDYYHSTSDIKANFVFKYPEDAEGSGWGQRTFKLASTFVNRFGEESHLKEDNFEIGFNNGSRPLEEGWAPSITITLKDKILNNHLIKKTKFYLRDSESEIYYLQFYIDHENLKAYSSTSNKEFIGEYNNQTFSTTWRIERDYMLNFNEVNSYESETMVSQEDAMLASTMTADYKCAVVANNRLYVGNVRQNGELYSDRMIKSPVNKYNILPASNFIDVAINDGDEITALAYYKDKILQFKKRKVFVINTSGDYEFLEDTFSNVGVNQQCQVVTTPHGIVWVNRRGCHLYDGQSMTNLIDNIIPETSDYTTITYNYWLASDTTYDGIPIVGYIDNRDTIIVKWEADDFTGTSIPDGASYHFPTKSWSLLARTFSGDNAQSSTGAISNMITDKDGDLLFYRYKSSDTTATSLIKKWNNVSYDNGGAKVFYFTTKDFTFGNISVRKKLYKVYITYKVKTDGTDSGVAVKGSINSSNDFDTSSGNGIAFSDSKSKFQGTSTACYGSSTLDETDGIWKTAEMIFSTPSEVNNIYSFQLQLSATAVPKDFEINDISIVYKTKSLK